MNATTGNETASDSYAQLNRVTTNVLGARYPLEFAGNRLGPGAVLGNSNPPAPATEQCSTVATNLSQAHFGMEWSPARPRPGGDGGGHTTCVTLDALPVHGRVSAHECDTRKDAAGRPIGTPDRVAVYNVSMPGVRKTLWRVQWLDSAGKTRAYVVEGPML